MLVEGSEKWILTRLNRDAPSCHTGKIHAEWPGLRNVNMIKTGERSYCIIAEWNDMGSLTNARPNMRAWRGRWLTGITRTERRRTDMRQRGRPLHTHSPGAGTERRDRISCAVKPRP
jgi:hypothetical protein